jgi:LacI family transcriptional regulator
VPRKRSGPTVVDVAKAAGVSTSTASRVLRGANYPVEERLRALVVAAAAEVGYVPNLPARNLRRGDAGFIGLVVGAISEPFFGDIAEAVTARARFHSMLAIVANMQRDPILELELCRKLWEQRVAGLILSGGSFDQLTHAEPLAASLAQMSRTGTVVVSLADRKLSVPTISADNRAVGVTLAKHVLSFEHRNVGVVFGPPNTFLNRDRLGGIIDTLRAEGLDPAVEFAEPGHAAGRAAAEALLDKRPGLTAILAGGDALAIGIVEYLHGRSLRVPDDVSVTGIGNTPYARLVRPTLTTVDVGIVDAGAAAVDYICAVKESGTASLPAVMPATIVAGESLSWARPSRPSG